MTDWYPYGVHARYSEYYESIGVYVIQYSFIEGILQRVAQSYYKGMLHKKAIQSLNTVSLYKLIRTLSKEKKMDTNLKEHMLHCVNLADSARIARNWFAHSVIDENYNDNADIKAETALFLSFPDNKRDMIKKFHVSVAEIRQQCDLASEIMNYMSLVGREVTHFHLDDIDYDDLAWLEKPPLVQLPRLGFPSEDQ